MHEEEMWGNCGYKLRCEELLELLQPTCLNVRLAQCRTEGEVRKLCLLLLNLQETGLDCILDDQLHSRDRPRLAKSMLEGG